jgi:hypothetical protein
VRLPGVPQQKTTTAVRARKFGTRGLASASDRQRMNIFYIIGVIVVIVVVLKFLGLY